MDATRIDVAGQTHPGMKRAQNEDSLLLLPEQGLLCVADGMGGHKSGEVASRVAVEEMAAFFERTGSDDEATWPNRMDDRKTYEENRLVTSVRLANRAIHERSRSDVRLKGMGTTMAALSFARGVAWIAHVGDSRVYLLRDGALAPLTEDHSLLNDFIKAKRMTPEEIERFPHKNVIVRALGMSDEVEVDTRREIPRRGDLFLLCSDGLSGFIEDDQIAAILNAPSDVDRACTRLIAAANAAGGLDNITVVLARVV
jgi:serine/threonine protein phosphatase PrpC